MMETLRNGSSDTPRHERLYDVPDVDVPKKPIYDVVKRLFDIVISLIALLVCALPIFVLAVIIRLDSEGPAIYSQKRLGKDGKPFRLYKLRSMYNDAEFFGVQWAAENDSRCTRIGSFLRKSRLDELPQFWNILIGQMSLVGPRPERPYFYNEFEKTIHGFSHRLKVRPGLTGLAQVNGGYDLLPEEKIVYDMRYIANRSVKLDLICIFKTVSVIFTHHGAR